ncbi:MULTISPECIES: hypothetical protein [Nostoc]|uniref:Uncharacterized protein n=1 Tax=Nostoc paludosum FACHB-159 TaxID=2692908 RepID=A0ABR8KMY4_9NOSO|nr:MULTISPECIES: hypothetical protein [Nostoc]MBD2683565.1 hypothetical protein [Nostoc sp. FACHB-857]MBD2739884.1 hypothetical protein [Nostoc paludosum FACHB-159]
MNALWIPTTFVRKKQRRSLWSGQLSDRLSLFIKEYYYEPNNTNTASPPD